MTARARGTQRRCALRRHRRATSGDIRRLRPAPEPSKVLLLDVVAPGEVDEDLER